jgi:alpha-ketoglutarate-dependent taurine dioxygenase
MYDRPPLTRTSADVSSRIVKFRYNNYDRATLDFTADDTERFYAAWQALSALIRDPASEIRLPLQPGSMVFINNERYAPPQPRGAHSRA